MNIKMVCADCDAVMLTDVMAYGHAHISNHCVVNAADYTEIYCYRADH